MRRLALRQLSWVLLALGLGCVRNPLPAPARPLAASVDILAVGHGDAILLSSATGKHVLIDGGEAETAATVLGHLRARGACPLDLILLTHRHSDHLGGLPRVVEACGTRQFMDSGYRHDTEGYLRLLAMLEEREIPLLEAAAGREIELAPGTVLTLLGPPRPYLGDGAGNVNANSVVARLAVGQSSVLLAGDANAAAEAWLLARWPMLRSTVLKVGHHGSRTSASAPFLAAVAPRLGVISNKPDEAKHPHPETLARLRAARATVIETAQQGTIHLELDGETVTWSSVRHPQKESVR